MTWREGIAYFVAAASLLTAAVFYRQTADARRHVQRAEEEASRRTQESRKLMDDARRRVDEAEQAPAEAAPTPVPVAESAPPGLAPTVITVGPQTVVNSPVVKDAIRKGVRAHVEILYKDLLDSWGLQGEDREKMLEILTDRQMLLMGQGEGTPEERRRRAEEILAQRLTPQQLAGLQEYDRTAGERAVLKEAEKEISALGLDPTRMWPLRDIILDEKKNEREAAARALAAIAPPQDATAPAIPKDPTPTLQKLLEVKRETNERVLQRARPLLTDAEYDTFCKQREAQLKIMDLSIQMLNASKVGTEAK